MSVSQQQAAAQLLKIRRASESFPGFMDYVHGNLIENSPWPPFMREFQEVLDLLEKDALVGKGGRPVRQIIVNMPPRHAKSFNGTVNFPGYCLMRKPHREVMIGAYNAELAATFGRGTRDIVTNPRLGKAFPKVELSRETRAVDFWKTTDGGAYYAVGMNGTTTGRGANALIIDDPYKSREEAESLIARRKVWDYYVSGFRSRLQPDRDGQPAFVIVTHTRWHPDDLTGRIMETPEFKSGEWLHFNFQALSVKERGVYVSRSDLPADDPRFMPPTIVDAEGQPVRSNALLDTADRNVSAEHEAALWPERFPVEWLKAQRSTIGEREFAALYQQQPYVAGGNIFKEKWFKRYNPAELPPFAAMVFGVDTAFKAKTTNDYSVFTRAAVTEAGDIYVLRVWREKMEYPDLKRMAINLNATYRGQGLRGFYIEDAASGQPLIQELQRDSGVPVIPWKPGASDKTVKYNAAAPLVEAGRVFIPDEADWLDDWLQEIVTVPSAKNDDQADSFVICLDVLSRMVVTGQRDWAAPMGDYLKSPDFGGAGMFTSQPLRADDAGWQGRGGFGAAIGSFEAHWGALGS